LFLRSLSLTSHDDVADFRTLKSTERLYMSSTDTQRGVRWQTLKHTGHVVSFSFGRKIPMLVEWKSRLRTYLSLLLNEY